MRPPAPAGPLVSLLLVWLAATTCRSAAPTAPAGEVRTPAPDAMASPPDAASPSGPTTPDALAEVPVQEAAGEGPRGEPGPSAGDDVPNTSLDRAPPLPLLVVIGGDLMAHKQVQSVAAEHAQPGDPASGWAWLLRELDPVWRRLATLGRTVIVANLEFPVAVQREEPTHWPPRFNGPPEALAGFRAAGIEVVTVANNHAYDQEREGLGETIAAARAAGLRPVGGGTAAEARAPAVLSETEPRVLLLDFAWTQLAQRTPREEATPRIAALEEAIEPDVRAAADDSELLVVVVHWMGEFQQRPIPAWREWVQQLADWGADAVIGHGPHVVGPVEFLTSGARVVPVAFSVGNLVSNMGWGVHPDPEAPLQETHDSEYRVEAREEALAVLRIVPPPEGSTGAWRLDSLWMIPVWLEDNRSVARPGGPLREIFPRPMPWCLPDESVGCFDGATERYCSGRLELLVERRAALHETLWGEEAPPLAPCPPEAAPYDPPPDFRTIPEAQPGPGLGGTDGGSP